MNTCVSFLQFVRFLLSWLFFFKYFIFRPTKILSRSSLNCHKYNFTNQPVSGLSTIFQSLARKAGTLPVDGWINISNYVVWIWITYSPPHKTLKEPSAQTQSKALSARPVILNWQTNRRTDRVICNGRFAPTKKK